MKYSNSILKRERLEKKLLREQIIAKANKNKAPIWKKLAR